MFLKGSICFRPTVFANVKELYARYVQVNGILLSTRHSWHVPRAKFLNVSSKRTFSANILGKDKGKFALVHIRNVYRPCRGLGLLIHIL